MMRCTCEEVAAGHPGLSPVCLAHLWLFQNLTDEEAEALMAAAWRKQYERGRYVFLQGEPAALLFVIKAGRVKLVKTDARRQRDPRRHPQARRLHRRDLPQRRRPTTR